MAEKSGEIIGISDVVLAEKIIIEKRRKRIYPDQKDGDGVETNLIGVALSGGGIRSAVTNLGVLYEMSRVGLFRSVDYLSTVSGGGYIGCCVSSLLSLKKNQDNVQQVNQSEKFASNSIYSYSNTDPQPSLFTTNWTSFPFRDLPVVDREEGSQQKKDEDGAISTDDKPMCRNFTSRDQVFHLRDRASFLLPRSLLFGTHVMRAVGAVTTSTIMSLLWFFSCITFICTLYMFITFSQWNMEVAKASSQTASVEQSEQSSITDSGEGEKSQNDSTSKKGIIGTIKGKASAAAIGIQKHIVCQSKAFFKLGSLYTLGVFGLMWGLCAPFYMKWLRKQYSKHFIESEDFENYIGRKQLKHVSLWTVFFIFFVLFCSFLFVSPVKSGHPDPRLLYLPFFCLCSFFGSCAMYCFTTFVASFWNRVSRAELSISSGIFFYAIIGSCLFAILPAFILIGNEAFLAIILVFLGFVLRYYFKDGSASSSAVQGEGLSVMLTKMTRWFMGMLVPLFILLAVVGVGSFLRDSLGLDGNAENIPVKMLILLICVSGLFAAFLSWLNYNRISPHVFYKDRLAEAFLATFMRTPTGKSSNCTQHSRMELARNSIEMDLVDLHGNYENSSQNSVENCAARGPYLLINSTLNLTAVRDLYGFRRQSTNFLFSRCFTGSERTGYVSTNIYDPSLKLGRAMTISGAAVTSVRGAGGTMAESFACTILGVRLGYWLRNPIAMVKEKMPKLWCSRNLFYELFRYTTSRHSHVYLSDGGHCGDNLGLDALFQRRVKLIIASDAECDQDHEFNSLNSSIRRAYVDHNIKISISLNDLIPDDEGNTARHFTIGRIFYPDRPWQKSWLLVIKNTMTGEESAPIRNYKKKSPTFPHETTADQFFSEEQFEAYRSLGREACSRIWKENIKIFRSPEWLNSPWSCIDKFCKNLDKLCSPEREHSDDESKGGKNSWDDIIRAIWKSEAGDFSSWQGFRLTIKDFKKEFDLKQHYSSNPLMVKQLFDLETWLSKEQVERKELNSQYDVPRTWEQFVEIRDLMR